MSYAAHLIETANLEVNPAEGRGDLAAVSVNDALVLLKRSGSPAEVAFARRLLEKAISTEAPRPHTASNVNRSDIDADRIQNVVQLLRESRTGFEARAATKALRGLIASVTHDGDSKAAGADVRLSSVNVLVVEDDVNYRTLLVKTLKRSGASVTSANDVQQAVEIIAKRKPDVIVSDINLPDQSGYKLMQWIQMQNAQIPVLAISGEPQDARNLQKSGFRLFFAKETGVMAQIVDSIAHIPEVVAPRLRVKDSRYVEE
jgi:CheY-like chemotaxis protein